MFFGEYEYRIDNKGRIPIPPRFRGDFKDGLVLARGLEKCIVVYTLAKWDEVARQLASWPATRSKTRRMNRVTFATAFNLELDGQGRVAVPTPLRQYAGIKDSVVVAGINEYLEIWSKEQWEAEGALMEEQAWQIAEGMEAR